MADQLIIVLGAGASFDASNRTAYRAVLQRPPLVAHLFSQDQPDDEILSFYPLAEMAGAEIRYQTSQQEGLEETLRQRYRESHADHDRRAFFQVPLYLQHRLLRASSAYVPDS